MKNKKTDDTAIKVKGFWSGNKNHIGAFPTNDINTKWIIFTSGHPVISQYVDLMADISHMFSEEGKAQIAKFQVAEVGFKRRILYGLNIMEEIDNDDDVALWEVDNKDRPYALKTSSSDYYRESLASFNLKSGAFVTSAKDTDGFRSNACFAITELLEIRYAIIDEDNKYVLLKKTPGGNIVKLTGEIGG